MTVIMPVPRKIILLSYQQGADEPLFLYYTSNTLVEDGGIPNIFLYCL